MPCKQQTLHIDKNMPLLAFNQFAPVKADAGQSAPPFFGAFHALTIDDAGGGTGFRSAFSRHCTIERVMNAIQRAVITPRSKIIVHRAAWRQVFGNIAPLASCAQHIHDAVKNSPQINAPLRLRVSPDGISGSICPHSSSVTSLGYLKWSRLYSLGSFRPHRQPLLSGCLLESQPILMIQQVSGRTLSKPGPHLRHSLAHGLLHDGTPVREPDANYDAG